MDWVEAVALLRRDGRPGVLATVIAVRGHAPRDAGAKMVISTSQTWGSVGGGNLEESVIHRARAMVTEGAEGPDVLQFGLTEHAPSQHGQQCCGGQVSVLLEPVAVRPTVAIFGMGHVGHELARILSRLDIVLHLVDSRARHVAPGALADVTDGPAAVEVHHAVAPESVLTELPDGAHVLVLTHDHAEDIAICDQALRRAGLGSIGLIGSAAKWARFRTALLREGHTEQTVASIQCPIGVPDIAGKEPAVIAVGVAADLLRILQAAPAQERAPAHERAAAQERRAARGAAS